MKVPLNELNTTLRLMRELNGLTQHQLAEAANLRQASISYVEQNQGGSNVGTIQQLAEALGYDLFFLFEKKKVKTNQKNLLDESSNNTAA